MHSVSSTLFIRCISVDYVCLLWKELFVLLLHARRQYERNACSILFALFTKVFCKPSISKQSFTCTWILDMGHHSKTHLKAHFLLEILLRTAQPIQCSRSQVRRIFIFSAHISTNVVCCWLSLFSFMHLKCLVEFGAFVIPFKHFVFNAMPSHMTLGPTVCIEIKQWRCQRIEWDYRLNW